MTLPLLKPQPPPEIITGTNLNLPFLKQPVLSRKLQLFWPIYFLEGFSKYFPLYTYMSFCSNLTLCRGLTLTPGILIWTYLNLSYLKMLPTSFCFYTNGFLKRRIQVFLKNTNNFFYNSLLFPWKRFIKTNLKILPLRMNCVKLGWKLTKCFLEEDDYSKKFTTTMTITLTIYNE